MPYSALPYGSSLHILDFDNNSNYLGATALPMVRRRNAHELPGLSLKYRRFIRSLTLHRCAIVEKREWIMYGYRAEIQRRRGNRIVARGAVIKLLDRESEGGDHCILGRAGSALRPQSSFCCRSVARDTRERRRGGRRFCQSRGQGAPHTLHRVRSKHGAGD
jgi:hypothetical protein